MRVAKARGGRSAGVDAGLVGLDAGESGFFLVIRLAAVAVFVILIDSHEGPAHASVAQLAEQLICNQQVVGSSPSASLRVE